MGYVKIQRETTQSDKSTVPEGFTLPMAIMDALPVVFFCGSAVLLGMRFPNLLFRVGAGLVILAGGMKVAWKFLIATCHKNIFFLNRQLRYLMPVGFLVVVIALWLGRSDWSFHEVWQSIISMPSIVFFVIGLAGIVGMILCAVFLDGRAARSNWIEQGINTVAQLGIFLGILFG